jgi:hypothetical protein
MRPYDESTQTYAAMFAGYARAVERFDRAAKARQPRDAYIPLFEALAWAVALDSRTKELWVPEGRDAPLGWRWRERVPGAELLRGIRYARNALHHDWADALRLNESGGLQFPMTFPAVFFEWVWRSADDLPAAEHSDAPGEAVYRAQMEGRAARVALAQLREAFSFLRSVLEPGSLRTGF